MMFRRLFVALILSVVVLASRNLAAHEPGWSMAVLPFSPEAQEIRQRDILDRPYRPGHVYGNTVRRMHYRGHPFPAPFHQAGQRGMFRRW